MMRIGLFGGTFDPVHNGHLRVAEEVRENFGLDRVYFVPSFIQPLKQHVRVTGADDRLHMIEMGTQGNPFFRPSRFETRRGGVSFSIDTVKAFAKRFDEVYFLIGADAFGELHLWKDYQDLFYFTDFIVMTRPARRKVDLMEMLAPEVRDKVRHVDESVLEHASGKRIHLHGITQLDISSTKIRELARNNQSIRYLVPCAVERFVRKKRLYRG